MPTVRLATRSGLQILEGQEAQAILAAQLADEQPAADLKAIDAERYRRIYLPIAPVDIKGDGSVMVEPDIRDERDENNLIALSLRATQLQGGGVTAAVIPFGAADNVEYMLTPAEMIAVAAAPFARASALFVRARELKAARQDPATAGLVDIEAGSVDGVGSWPN